MRRAGALIAVLFAFCWIENARPTGIGHPEFVYAPVRLLAGFFHPLFSNLNPVLIFRCKFRISASSA